MRKCKIKRKILIIVSLLVVFTMIIGAGLYYAAHKYADRIFVWYENSRLGLDAVTVEETQCQTVLLSLADLKSDDRVVFDQSMMLINTKYMLGADFVAQIGEYKDTGVYMNECMLSAYAALSASVTEKQKTKLYVSSHFRTAEKQAILYEEDPNTATLPGASEHQSGLCVDVYVAGYAGDAFIKSPAGRYVNRNAYRYGFIVRYPCYGEEQTGIRYEPWHFRYVGVPHAEIIHQNRMTLEEYVLGLEIGQWYEANGYRICRQMADENGCLQLPQLYERAIISTDNTGCYIVTVKM